MKFEINQAPKRNIEDAVAYVDSDGDIRIRRFPDVDKDDGAIAISEGDFSQAFSNLGWYPENAKDGQLFFPGDSITITF